MTTRGSGFDTLLAVFTGDSPGTLLSVAQDDDSGGFFTSLVTFNCTQGVTYQVVVAGYKGATGAVVLGLPPGTGFNLSSLPLPVITQQPSSEIVEAGAKLTLTVSALNATTYQWFFAGAPIFNAQSNIFTITDFPATAVGNYYVQVGNSVGSIQSATASAEIAAQRNLGLTSTPDTLAVDKFGDAVDLTTASTTTRYRPLDGGGDTGGFVLSQSFSTVGATKELGEPNHAGQAGGASYWYAYTARDDGTLEFDTIGSTFNTILAVYTGPGSSFSSLTSVGSDFTTNYVEDGQPSVLVTNATSGTTYYVAVDGYQGASGAAVLNVLLHPTNSVNTNVPPITNKLVVLTVKSPVNNQLTTNSNFGINGTVQGAGGYGLDQVTVEIAVNTNSPVAATLGAAARVTSWSLTNIALLPGVNVITAEAYSMNADGTTNAALPVSRNVFLVPALPVASDKATITLLTNGDGHIAGIPNNASLELNKVYTVTAVPSANWVFTNWSSGTNTNSLTTLEPNTAALPFVMSSNLILQANFVTNPFTALAGTVQRALCRGRRSDRSQFRLFHRHHFADEQGGL